MKTGLKIFLNSAGFGIVIAAVYWLVARHPAGTVLLGLMAVGMLFIAGYMLVAERHANLAGDDKSPSFEASAGTDLGIFTGATAWPLIAAVGVFAVIIGAIWSLLFAALGGLTLLYACYRLARESARL